MQRNVLDRVFIVKPVDLDYPKPNPKKGGIIVIKSIKLKECVGREVRVIIRTYYRRKQGT